MAVDEAFLQVDRALGPFCPFFEPARGKMRRGDMFKTTVVVRSAGAELESSHAAGDYFIQIAGEEMGDGGKVEHGSVVRVECNSTRA